MYVPRAMYSLRMSFWIVPASAARGTPRSSADRDVEREQRGRGRVDGHRRRDLVEREPVEQHAHVVERADRDAHAADLAARQRVVGVAPHLRRQIERHREPGLPAGEQELVAAVRLVGGAEAGVLAHRPQPPAVHRRLHAARERELAREAEVARRHRTAGVQRPPGCRRRTTSSSGMPAAVSRRVASAALVALSRAPQRRPRSRGRRRRRSASARSCAWISLDRDARARARAARGPRGVTSMTARSVMMRWTTPHAGQRQRALARGSSARRPSATCSIITIDALGRRRRDPSRRPCP